jgi:hypothetical protein
MVTYTHMHMHAHAHMHSHAHSYTGPASVPREVTFKVKVHPQKHPLLCRNPKP